jgi:transcriptional regulator with XRE-family HTH domain
MPRKKSSLKKLVAQDVATGKAIKRAREEIGMSGLKLAEALGVSHTQVQKYEGGRNRIPIDKLRVIAEMTNRPITFFGVDDNERDAERYRWIRANVAKFLFLANKLQPFAFDEAIDEAIRTHIR